MTPTKRFTGQAIVDTDTDRGRAHYRTARVSTRSHGAAIEALRDVAAYWHRDGGEVPADVAVYLAAWEAA